MIQTLRNLVFALERIAVEEAASGAVKGAAGELRDQIPDDVERKVRLLAQDTLTVLSRLAHEAATRDRDVAATGHRVAESVTRGALDELERQWREGGLPLHDFLERLNRLLDHAARFAASRAEEHGDRAHEMAARAVEGVTEELHEFLPQIAEDLRTLAPLGGEIAFRIGRGLLDGVESRAKENPEALNAIVEQAGRALIHGIARGIDEEVTAHGAQLAGAGARASALAEEAAAASVRGATRALAEPLRQLGASVRPGALKTAAREVTSGIVETVSAALRVPALAAASGGAVLAAAFLVLRLKGR